MKKKYNKQKHFGYDSNGKRIVKWFHADTKWELEQQIQKYKLQLELTPNASNIKFKDYAEKWRTTYKGNRSKATQDMYKYALTHTTAIDDYPLTKITKTKCQECIQSVWDRPTTAKNVSNTLRQIFNAAVADGILLRNPALNLDLPKRSKPKFHLLTDRELEAVRKADLNASDRMFVTILQVFGLRPSEALALMPSDFDLEDRMLHITKAIELGNDNLSKVKSTKTGACRDIPIPDALVPQLRSYFAQMRGFYLFCNEDNSLITKSQYRAIFERIRDAVNVAMGGTPQLNVIPEFTLYSFRHYRATELYYLTQSPDHPISLLQASTLMGHSINVFLNTYSHVMDSQEDLRRIYDLPLKSVTNL